MDDFYTDLQKDMWSQVEKLKPDALFLIGDNVYADRRGGAYIPDADMETVFQRYEETRFALQLYRQEKLIPVFSTWDDHDLGQDNGHRETRGMPELREIFRLFFPGDEQTGVIRGPGVASRLSMGPYRFHLMDNRSFRVPKSKGEEQYPSAHWGAEQEEWLLDGLREQGDLLHLVLNGDQYFGGYTPEYESYEADHPRALQSILKRIRDTGAKAVFFSGDRHFLEIQELEKDILGYPTFELTTSAIHARVFESHWKTAPNPRQKVGVANIQNFLLVDFSRERENWVLAVEGRGPGSRSLLSERLKVPVSGGLPASSRSPSPAKPRSE